MISAEAPVLFAKVSSFSMSCIAFMPDPVYAKPFMLPSLVGAW
jgi:hypothetical protein